MSTETIKHIFTRHDVRYMLLNKAPYVRREYKDIEGRPFWGKPDEQDDCIIHEYIIERYNELDGVRSES